MDWKAWLNRGKEPTKRLPCSPVARAIVENAAREARRLNHDYVGAEHLLFAMVELQGSSVSKLLADSGVTSDLLKPEMEKLRMNGSEPLSKLPFTPRSRRIWVRAEKTAQKAGAIRINEGHILFSLLEESEGQPAKWFRKWTVPLDVLKERTFESIIKA